jgi:hypothetical protein
LTNSSLQKLSFNDAASLVGISHIKSTGLFSVTNKIHYPFGGSINKNPTNSPLQYADERMVVGFIDKDFVAGNAGPYNNLALRLET